MYLLRLIACSSLLGGTLLQAKLFETKKSKKFHILLRIIYLPCANTNYICAICS
jgi:hypothetical protein